MAAGAGYGLATRPCPACWPGCSSQRAPHGPAHAPNVLTKLSPDWFRWPDETTREVHRLLNRVPDDAPVFTNDPAVTTHLARRELLILHSALSPGDVDVPGALSRRTSSSGRSYSHYAPQADLERLGAKVLGRAGNYTLLQSPRSAGPAG